MKNMGLKRINSVARSQSSVSNNSYYQDDNSPKMKKVVYDAML